MPPTILARLLIWVVVAAPLAAAGCDPYLADLEQDFYDDDDEEELTRAMAQVGPQSCGPHRQTDPFDSIGRPMARLVVSGPVAHAIMTNTGRRELPEVEVNGPRGAENQSWLSGCVGKFCMLYWQPPSGHGTYANVSRAKVRVWNGSKFINASKCLDAAMHATVRRLGGPPVAGRTVLRYLVATPALDAFFHPTNGSTVCERGCAPLAGYACTHKVDGACHNVTGADAPPNTPQGGKGYATGIYLANAGRRKPFHKLAGDAYTVTIPVYRYADNAPAAAEWVYGYVNTTGGRVYMWVIRRVLSGGEQVWGYVVK